MPSTMSTPPRAIPPTVELPAPSGTTPPLREILEFNAPIPTWFRCGGTADALARPRSIDELRDLLQAFACQPVRILGDGANLLVADEGVDGVVISLERMNAVTFEGEEASSHQAIKASSEEKQGSRHQGIEGPSGSSSQAPSPKPHAQLVRAEAGAKLPLLITECVRRGLAGLETLAGIPATVGGAVVMNAGGSFGQLCDTLVSVEALTRFGQTVSIPKSEVHFTYRHSGLNHLVITAATFELRRVAEHEQPALREKLKEVMAYKKGTQPMAANSAGCCFKNPTLARDVDGIGRAGERVSAGLIIDRAGCKGLRVGSASVSERHANFLMVDKPAATVSAEQRESGTPAASPSDPHPPKARDVIDLIALVQQRVRDRFAIDLKTEVVIWRRSGGGIHTH